MEVIPFLFFFQKKEIYLIILFLLERKRNKTKNMWIAAFDIGVKNFAFAVVEGVDNVLHVDLHDLRAGNSPYINLISYLDRHQTLWKKVDVVLIEQQLYRTNVAATKLSCHLHAYFLHRFPQKKVIEYPSSYKTKYTKFSIKSSSHKQRKDYAIQYVLDKCQKNDPVLYDWLLTFPKKDDICDCILMCETFYASPFSASFSSLM